MDKLGKFIKNWLDSWTECSKCNDMVTMRNVKIKNDLKSDVNGFSIILCNKCVKEESAQ